MRTRTELKTDMLQERSPLDVLVDILAEKLAHVIGEKKPVEKRFLNIEESEAYTDLSGSTLRLRVREGKLRKIKNGGRVFFEREDLDRMLTGETETENDV
ncbi:helix-turn-helix domain-containing protein [Candidatus Bathyarchaeota archaeon]|jgi:hypothetical protein|nr:helix-turn-helix domain-containing protein [Candidatus Bathyarchaeota archaeon]